MKKIVSSLIALFIFISSSYAVLPKKIDFSVGLSSGIPLYGSSEIKNAIDSIENPNRIIIGTFANANINPIKYATFSVGTELLADFCWNSDINTNLMHMDFPLGLKIYPGFGGLGLGLAYTLGFCTVMIKDDAGNKYNDVSPWGNGFKLFLEYDFSRTAKSIYFPTIGVTWNLMPRGNNNYDNLIVFYLSEHL